MVVTRKIQLLIGDYDKTNKTYSVSEKNDDVYKYTWKELNKLNYNSFIVANKTTTELYKNTNALSENFVDNKENKRDNAYRIGLKIVEELKLDFEGYKEILNCVCRNASQKLKNDRKEIRSGKRTLANYKIGNPIPFQSQNKPFVKQNSDYYITLFKLHFKLHFGRDGSNNRHVIEQIEKNNYKFCDSSIQIKNGKIFLLLAVQMPDKNILFDKNICLGVDLGMSVPAYLALNSNPKYRKSLGSFNDYTKRRLSIQNAYERSQRSDVGFNGKGRKQKNKKIERLSSAEKNYCRTYEHRITKMVIDEALKYNAGTIKLENLKGYNKPFGKRNWGYHEYQTKIQQKAQKYGIDVVFVDPRNTSKTCSTCGCVNEDLDCLNKNKQMNKKREWVCKNCSTTLQRDWNAAYNIANSTKYLEK